MKEIKPIEVQNKELAIYLLKNKFKVISVNITHDKEKGNKWLFENTKGVRNAIYNYFINIVGEID